MGVNIIWLALVCILYIRTTQGQNRTQEATVNQDFLYSPGYEYGQDYPSYFTYAYLVVTNYDNQTLLMQVTDCDIETGANNHFQGSNFTYDYLVFTNYDNHTILMQVTDCDIETGKKNECYDKLSIYDGFNQSATLLDEFCCPDANYPSWQSSGSQIYLIFETDESNVGKGFKISFVSDGPTTTTSTTTTSTTSTSTSTTSTTTTTTPTTTTTSTTTSTTTTPPTTTTTDPPTTEASTAALAQKSGDGNSNTMTYIIVGVCAGVAVIVIIVVVIVCLLIKSKKGNVLPMDSKSAFWRVQPNGREPTATSIIPPKFPSPPGHVETNMFDMELPEGRGNLLPPLSPQLPVVESTTTTN